MLYALLGFLFLDLFLITKRWLNFLEWNEISKFLMFICLNDVCDERRGEGGRVSGVCGCVFFILVWLNFLGGHVINWCERVLCS